jgi:hypothetical protein
MTTKMTTEQFIYWLKGFIEINGNLPTPEQWEIIKNTIKNIPEKITANATCVKNDFPTIPSSWPIVSLHDNGK